MRRAKRLAALIFLIATMVFPASFGEQPTPGYAQSATDTPPNLGANPDKHPKLASGLVAVARTERERGPAAAIEAARAGRMGVSGNRVRVTIEAAGAGVSAAHAAAVRVGGIVEGEYANLVQATIPPNMLETLAVDPAVSYVRPPYRLQPEATNGQGVGSTGASVWQAAGNSGAGAKIAVVDSGFSGYTQRQASGDLPANLTTVDFCSGGFTTDTDHGTGVAEIAHEMAPAAQLFLICVATEVNLGQAKDYAKTNGIKIISHSVSWFNSGRGDGSGGPGTPNGIVADARANGILWVNAAGNRAQQHWSGTYSDTDADGSHNFTSTDNGNSIFVSSGDSVCVYLKWDNWPSSAQDYDLYLVRNSSNTVVEKSEGVQSGTQAPTEDFCFSNSGASGNFDIFITRFSATSTPKFDLYAAGHTLQYQVAEGSITEPGSSPNALAVAAVCWQNAALEPYSGRGPTIDGRTKPDIAGPDAVSSATYGDFSQCGASGFTGTSASTPHVAGAAALVLAANPGFGPVDLQNFLQNRAVDLGAAGMDNSFGFGRLDLGAVPGGGGGPTQTPTRTPTITQTALPGATSTPTVTSTVPPVGPVGGTGFGLNVGTFGQVNGTWNSGAGQLGYVVFRLDMVSGAFTVLPVGGALGPGATSFADNPLTPGGIYCYMLVPFTAGGFKQSDIVCAFRNTRTPTGAPENLNLRLNQSSTPSLSWGAPVGGGQAGYNVRVIVGAATPPAPLDAGATGVNIPITGLTCFQVDAIGRGSSDILCAIPGASTL